MPTRIPVVVHLVCFMRGRKDGLERAAPLTCMREMRTRYMRVFKKERLDENRQRVFSRSSKRRSAVVSSEGKGSARVAEKEEASRSSGWHLSRQTSRGREGGRRRSRGGRLSAQANGAVERWRGRREAGQRRLVGRMGRGRKKRGRREGENESE